MWYQPKWALWQKIAGDFLNLGLGCCKPQWCLDCQFPPMHFASQECQFLQWHNLPWVRQRSLMCLVQWVIRWWCWCPISISATLKFNNWCTNLGFEREKTRTTFANLRVFWGPKVSNLRLRYFESFATNENACERWFHWGFGSSTWARTRDLRINRKQFLQTMHVLCDLQALKHSCAINCVIAHSL
jgi:hypothetical protein